MKRWIPIVVGVVVAIVCARLGLWQLDRLEQRRAANAVLAEQLADTITVSGTFDHARDSVLTLRAWAGVPGVWILTPLVREDGDTLLVNRGFAPSPDGRTIDMAAYREPGPVTVTGVVVDGVLRRLERPAGPPERMVAVGVPALDDGPHLGYALQWFTFGLIGLVGGSILGVKAGRAGLAMP